MICMSISYEKEFERDVFQLKNRFGGTPQCTVITHTEKQSQFSHYAVIARYLAEKERTRLVWLLFFDDDDRWPPYRLDVYCRMIDEATGKGDSVVYPVGDTTMCDVSQDLPRRVMHTSSVQQLLDKYSEKAYKGFEYVTFACTLDVLLTFVEKLSSHGRSTFDHACCDMLFRNYLSYNRVSVINYDGPPLYVRKSAKLSDQDSNFVRYVLDSVYNHDTWSARWNNEIKGLFYEHDAPSAI